MRIWFMKRISETICSGAVFHRALFHGVLVLTLTAVLSTGVWAAKPEGKGDGGADKRPQTSYGKQDQEKSLEKNSRMGADEAQERMREHRNDDNAYRHDKSSDRDVRQDRDRDGHDDDDRASGLAKQRDIKADQEQKELGRGSEQGQEAREEHSRKWWKIWE